MHFFTNLPPKTKKKQGLLVNDGLTLLGIKISMANSDKDLDTLNYGPQIIVSSSSTCVLPTLFTPNICPNYFPSVYFCDTYYTQNLQLHDKPISPMHWRRLLTKSKYLHYITKDLINSLNWWRIDRTELSWCHIKNTICRRKSFLTWTRNMERDACMVM